MRSTLLRLMLLVFASASPALASFPSPPTAVTHTAAATGSWNQTATWGGPIPGDDAIVRIPAGRNVTVTSQETARLKFILVEGELRMWIHGNTRLSVETLYVAPGGRFVIGGPANPVKPGVLAEVVFISSGPIDLTWDPTQESRGLISDGTVQLYGETKTNMVRMKNSALKGSGVIDIANTIPADWKANDEIVITGTHFRKFTQSQDEKVRITAISGTTIGLDRTLVNDHVRVRTDLDMHIANLTRNIVLRSESLSIPDRGHVMFRGGTADLRYVAFVNLGRTNKTIPLDDLIVNTTTGSVTPRPNNQIMNRRGRYAVHFHQLGVLPVAATPPNNVFGCVVTGAAGWGIVNHSSHVAVQKNVVYDFAGAAFVTEAGDELGNFLDNIAIRGTGDGTYHPFRINFGNLTRPQPLGDFGFRGDGFWFQGPAIRVLRNVANGCNGVGIIWHTTGGIDPAINRYVGFPRSALSPVYGTYPNFASLVPRYWNYSVTNEKLIVADLPILEFDTFDAYGNYIGVHLRFNNHPSNAWYTEDPYNYDVFIVTVPGANRLRQSVKNLNLWNNEQGFRGRYNTKTDWVNVKNINRLNYSDTGAHFGAEHFHAIESWTITNVTTDGYEVAGLIEEQGGDATNEITFNGQNYANYANPDTWYTTVPCPAPTGVTVSNITSTSARISWTSNAANTRYMVRYKISTDQQWKFATPSPVTGNFVNLLGLTPGRTYIYQVIGGCTQSVSNWSSVGSFQT